MPRQRHRAAAEAEAGLFELPAALDCGEHGGAVELDRAPIERAVPLDPDPFGRDIGGELEIECATARALDIGLDLAAAPAQFRRAHRARQREIAAPKTPQIETATDTQPCRIEQQCRLHRAAPHRNGRRPGKADTAGIEIGDDLLDAADRRKGEVARQAPARQIEPSVEPAGYAPQHPARRGARDVEPGNRDLDRSSRRYPDHAIAAERAEHRSTLGVEGETLGIGIEMKLDIGQAERIHRALQEQIELGPCNIAVEHEAHRTILVLNALPLEMEGAVASAQAIARKPDARCGDLEPAQIDDAVRPAFEPGGDHRQPACKIAQEIIVEAANPGLRRAHDARALAPRAGDDAEIGLHVDNADAGDEIAVELTSERDVVPPRLQIDEQRRLARQLVRSDAQAVAGDGGGGDVQITVDAEIGENAARHVAHPGYAPRRQLQWHGDGRLGQPPLTRGAQLLEPGLVDGYARRGEQIFEPRGLERPVEHSLQPRRLPTQIGKERGGPAEIGGDAEIIERRTAKIDNPLGIDRNRARAQLEHQIKTALFKRAAPFNADARFGEPGDHSLADERRGERARQRISALLHAQPQIDHAVAADIEAADPLPVGPATIARDARGDRALAVEQPREHPACGGRQIEIEIETVAIGFGIEEEFERIAAALDPRGQIDPRAAIADNGIARQTPHLPFAGQRGLDPEPVYPQRADTDIKTGQDRPRFLAGVELGFLVQRREFGGGLPDRQRVAQPGERLPVEPHFGRIEQQPFGVVDPQIDDPRLVVDRSVDPPDPDAEPGFGCHALDPVDDQPVARPGIKHQQQPENGEHDRQRDSAQPGHSLAEPAPTGLAFGQVLLGGRGFAVHQKACPSDT